MPLTLPESAPQLELPGLFARQSAALGQERFDLSNGKDVLAFFSPAAKRRLRPSGVEVVTPYLVEVSESNEAVCRPYEFVDASTGDTYAISVRISSFRPGLKAAFIPAVDSRAAMAGEGRMTFYRASFRTEGARFAYRGDPDGTRHLTVTVKPARSERLTPVPYNVASRPQAARSGHDYFRPKV